MRLKRRLIPAVIELAAVLLATALAFAWGRQAALAERGYSAAGGEYMLLLLPAVYYIGKRTVLDWARELGKRKPPPMTRTSGTAGRKAKSNNHPHYRGRRRECQVNERTL